MTRSASEGWEESFFLKSERAKGGSSIGKEQKKKGKGEVGLIQY